MTNKRKPNQKPGGKLHKRTIYLSTNEVEALRELSLKATLPMAEIVRRALDEYLARWE